MHNVECLEIADLSDCKRCDDARSLTGIDVNITKAL